MLKGPQSRSQLVYLWIVRAPIFVKITSPALRFLILDFDDVT